MIQCFAVLCRAITRSPHIHAMPDVREFHMQLVVESIRKNKGSNQAPGVDPVAYPCADDLRPTRPVRSSNRHEVSLHVLLIKVSGEKRSDPCCAKEEDDVEKSVVVLCGVTFVVTWILCRSFILVITIRIVQSRCGERSAFNSGTESCLAHFAAGLRLLGYETVLILIIFGSNLRVTVAIAVGVALVAEGEAISCSTGGGVSYSDEGDDGANDDSSLARSTGAD